MNFDEYQKLALKTANFNNGTINDQLLNSVVKIYSESEDIIETVKKDISQGRSFSDVVIADKLGDMLWHLSLTSRATYISLSDIAKMNITKQMLNYPERFNADKT